MAKPCSKPASSACWRTRLPGARALGAAALLLLLAACATPPADGNRAATAIQLTSAEYLESYRDSRPPPGSVRGRTVPLPAHPLTTGKPGPGFHWLRLRIDLDPQRDVDLAVYVPRVAPNATFYFNGSRIGTSEANEDPAADTWNYPQLFPLPNGLIASGENQILIGIRSATWHEYMVVSRVAVGPEALLHRRYLRRIWVQVRGVELVSLLTGVIGLFALLLWLRRRSEVVFGLFALACGIWIFRNTQFFLVRMSSVLANLADASLFWLVAVLFRFVCRLLERPLPRLERALFVVAFVMTVALLAVPDEYEAALSSISYALLIPPSAALMVYLTVLTLRERTIEHYLLWLAALVTCATGAYDLLVLVHMTPWPGGYIMPYSALFFALTLGWVLTDRFVAAHTRYERLNRELDLRVQAREQELAVQYQHAAELEREQAIASERERMLRDMHDGMGLQLISSMRLVERSDLSREQVSAMLTETMDELRIAIDSAKPTGRDLLLMLGNLRYRLEPRLQAAGLALHWEVGDVEHLDRLMPGQVAEITRIVQEAFTNVLKHAGATQLWLRIDAQPGQLLVLTIADNGRGFDAATVLRGEGLRNMRNRAEKIGAWLTIDSQPGSTRVGLVIPIAEPGV